MVKAIESELDKYASLAFGGARFHLKKIKERVNSPAVQTIWSNDKNLDETARRKLQADINIFHWHLRAYFWELIAAFDTMLQWANQRYKFGLSEVEVRWKKIPKQARKYQAEWDQKYALLEETWNSSWFYEVRMYRNFAHRAFQFVQSDIGDELNIICLLPMRVGQQQCQDLREQLSYYLKQMGQLGKKIFNQ